MMMPEFQKSKKYPRYHEGAATSCASSCQGRLLIWSRSSHHSANCDEAEEPLVGKSQVEPGLSLAEAIFHQCRLA